MKGLFLTSLLVVVVSATLEDHGATFQSFKLKHNKTYKNQIEETQRFAIFRDNIRKIEEHNSLYEQGLKSYKLGVNQFADITEAEFESMLALQTSTKPKISATQKFVAPEGFEVPASYDWRQQGYVTPVKNQGTCGSCWAFALTGGVEGQYFHKNKKLVSLSEQQLVDCTTDVNNGCEGGSLDGTFPYIEKHGLVSEADYPYTASDGTCNYDATKVVTKVDSYVSVSGNEHALLQAVASVGPVSVAIYGSTIQFYESGVYDNIFCSFHRPNHGVLIVGYGAENGKDYWIVKNSWGTSWGENGYIKMRRGNNQCDITYDTVYPVIN